MKNLSPILFLAILLFSCGSAKDSNKSAPQFEGITYTGGNGSSYDNAIKIIGVANSAEGVNEQFKYISEKYGKRGKDWDAIRQQIKAEGRKYYEIITIKLHEKGTTKTIYFDATSYYLKKKVSKKKY